VSRPAQRRRQQPHPVHAVGSERVPTSQAKLAKYRADTQAAIDTTARAGALFVLASPPAGRSGDDWRLLDSLYRDVAFANPDVEYADASAATAPDGRFAPSQTRLPFERFVPQARADCITAASLIPVRGHDAAHFCPMPRGALCNGHSSGAMRYAINLLSAAPVGYDVARATPHGSTPVSADQADGRTTGGYLSRLEPQGLAGHPSLR
jgi:hypothetical protein